jgi:hypothetical protein
MSDEQKLGGEHSSLRLGQWAKIIDERQQMARARVKGTGARAIAQSASHRYYYYGQRVRAKFLF